MELENRTDSYIPWLVVVGTVGVLFYLFNGTDYAKWVITLPPLIWTVYTDVKDRIIPHTTVLILLAAGFWFNGIDALGGMFGCMAVFVIFYLAGTMGAGDLKLGAAIGSLFGFQTGMIIITFSCLSALVVVLINRIRQKELKRYLIDSVLITPALLTRDRKTLENTDENSLVPLGAFFLPGVLITWILMIWRGFVC